MRYAKHPFDIWDGWGDPDYVVAIPTNGDVKGGSAVMGAGLALQARKRVPDLPKAFGQALIQYGNIPLYFKRWSLLTIPTKKHFWESSNLPLIERSCIAATEAVTNQAVTILVPKLGCGCGGLLWDVVSKVMEQTLDDRFVLVTDPHEKAS